MDAMEKLGLKRRIVAHDAEGFGKVHLRDLTAKEWRECIEDKGKQARRLLSMSMVSESGERLFTDDDEGVESLPPALIKSIVDGVSKIAGFSEDAAKN